ncbi:MAG: PilW family protein, partial [Sulfuricaulis sp.]|nr:PilW family protein [Sulfuricaulis sp.]
LNKSITVKNNLNTPTDYMTDFGPGKHLTGHAYVGPGNAPSAWEPDLPAAYFVADEVVENTDVLVIRRAAETGIKIKDSMKDASDNPDPSANVKITGNPSGLNQFDIVMLGDCESADVFQITGPASLGGSGDNVLTHNSGVGTPGNFVKPFSKAYDNNAEILKLVTSIYYVGRRGNVATNPPALFRKELAGTTGGGSIAVSQELLEGVEIMNVMYGEDTDNNRVADRYFRANNVTNFANVLNARVGIVVRTVATVESQPDTKIYDVAGVSYDPVDDKYRRQVYNSTITVRNP